MSPSPMPARPDADAVLDALDPEQREVASAPSGPMCVLAGAGTGKTRAITHRIAYAVLAGVHQPQHVLALTFTARAAGEMRTRLRQLGVGGVQARTFHAAALRQLHYFWPRAVGGVAPEVMSHKAAAVAEALGRLRIRADRTLVRDAAAEIEWAKVGLLTAETYAAAVTAARREPPGMDATGMARLIQAYEDVKSARRVIDFEDVLLVTAGILADRPDIARVVREQYRHFVVDEYQDVNALQQRVLDLWLGGRDDLCVVGDPAQTIYSFTGATPEHLLTFPNRYEGSTTVRLVRNYRSTPQIVGLANLVVTGPSGTTRSHAVRLRAENPDGVAPVINEYSDEPAEADAVAASIAGLVAEGHDPSEIAILFRTNAQSEAFESALAQREIPYLVRGGERFFTRREVKESLVLLRGAARSDDGSQPLPELVRDILVGAGWSRTAPTSGGAARERWESLHALAALSDTVVASTPEARLPDFVRELLERAAAQHAPPVNGITLASLHAAKGLEWDTVFLAGCSDGYLPITMAETADEIEEERRLLYVGVTRARSQLVLSWAAARNPGSRPSRRPSRFLDGAGSVLGGGVPATERAERPRRRARKKSRPTLCRQCGSELVTAAERTVGRCSNCPATYDEGTFERLREWRLGVARDTSVPAFVVFTDATLTAIAERRPATRAELSDIPGVGPHKLERYAEPVLALLHGD